ncbi:hypothetical protein ACO0RG_003105 [Hanseniaspora osmophila]|uniref:Acyl-protein thioesterase 1 n=1 Tax=Hanseniaspora osmophila TaxID=56408 RepID=A0A1E5RF62_9ASCO|nr:Acyl-protein thioesterase 1 [Hanseniaspora osmophila]
MVNNQNQNPPPTTKNSTPMQSYKIIKPLANPVKNCLIFSHGLGDTNEGWYAMFHQLTRQFPQVFQNTIVYLPLAPVQPVSLNFGMPMTSWFDIVSLSGSGNSTGIDDEAINARNFSQTEYVQSLKAITDLCMQISREHAIPTEKIVVGGFSQGAALSLGLSFYAPFKLGGIVALSGFPVMVDAKFIKKNHIDNLIINKDTPVFQGHGEEDPMVDLKFAENAKIFYTDENYLGNISKDKYMFKKYKHMGHSTCDEEMADMVDFLKTLLK